MDTTSQLNYPTLRRDESVSEELHGVNVADPYRWLEDPDSDETVAFVKAQNEISSPFLSTSPTRAKFHSRWVDWSVTDHQCMSCSPRASSFEHLWLCLG